MAIRGRRSRRLFVTGGTGFLGRHIVNGAPTQPFEVIAPGSAGLDLRHRDSVLTVIREWKPHAIIHTAYRRGDRRSIVDASSHVAEAAHIVGARLVHVSTDALFRGQLAPYTELDPPSPVHEYGRDKADAETAVADADPTAIIVRTSLLLGTDELSVHEIAVRDALNGPSIMTFFTDEIRSPLLVGDLAAALVDLTLRPELHGVLNLGGPDPLSRAELARMIADRHGWDTGALRTSTIAEAGLSRPSKVVLDSSRAASYGLAVRGPTGWL